MGNKGTDIIHVRDSVETTHEAHFHFTFSPAALFHLLSHGARNVSRRRGDTCRELRNATHVYKAYHNEDFHRKTCFPSPVAAIDPLSILLYSSILH